MTGMNALYRVLLDANESRWSAQLESAGLVVQVLDTPASTGTAAAIFGDIFAESPSAGWDALFDYPASLVMAFTGVATTGYHAGSFWPAFWDTTGIPADGNQQAVWGEAYLSALRTLGLPTFPSLPRRYLGTILMHAGIPNYCLDDYFAVLQHGMKRVGADASAIVHWAIPRLDTTFPNIDQPVRRFIQYGNDYAVDFIESTIDALQSLSQDPDAVVTAMVPERVVEAARRYLLADRRRERDFKNRIRSRPKAEILLDAHAGEIQLRLPGLVDLPEAPLWRISADGSSTTVRAPILAGGRSRQSSEATWRIVRPVRHLTIRVNTMADDQDIALVREHDPILFFQESGEYLPNHVSLPPEPVWVMFVRPVGEDLAFQAAIVREEMPPMGWAGWSLALVDLSTADRVQLTIASPIHDVRKQSRATLDHPSQIPWITMQGLPVGTERPTLHLPDNISAAWRLRVTDLDSHILVVDRSLESHTDFHDAVDPFSELPSPLAGRFEVSVKGPYGRGAVRQLAIIEGLQVTPNNPWRHLAAGGLTPLEISLLAPHLDVTPSEVTLGPQEPSALVDVVSPSQSWTVTLTPPATAVATLVGDRASRWSHGFVRVYAEDLMATSLLVRIPRGITSPVLEVWAPSQMQQQVRPLDQTTVGYATYPLDRITDTVRALGACDLLVTMESVPVRIARVEPKRIATGIFEEDGSLVLEDFTGGEVEVRLWSLYAPWVTPVGVAIDGDGRAALPMSLLGLGPLCASWQRVDPWIPSEWPWMPDPRDAMTFDAPIDELSLPPASALLVGLEASPPTLNVAFGWYLLGMARRFTSKYSWARVYDLLGALRTHPNTAMRELVTSGIPDAERLELLIQSGVLWSDPSLDEAVPPTSSDSRELMQHDRLTGSLIVLPMLMDATQPADPEVWSEVRQTLGHQAIDILTTGIDAARKAGSFADARIYDGMSQDTFEEVVAMARIVPKAMLDPDSRSAAALKLFLVRDHDDLLLAGRDGRTRLEFQHALLRDWRWEQADELLTAREERDGRGGWPSLSAQSIGFALMARLAARGEPQAETHMNSEMRHWMAIARCAPDLVSADLVLAEAMALAHFSPHLAVAPATGEDMDSSRDIA